MAITTPVEHSYTHTQLLKLLDLQQLDNRIMDLEEERELIPEQQEKLESALMSKRRQLDDSENQVAHLESELTDKQRVLDLENIKLKNARSKETAVDNIKQYEAFMREVEHQEQTSEEIQEDIVSIKKRIKQILADRKSLESDISTMLQKQKETRKELDAHLKELDEKLEGLYDQRDEMIENIDESIYLKYEYIAERKEGLAISRVAHGHCLTCNMAIPPQMYNELIRGNELMACPACSRILIYHEIDDIDDIEENGSEAELN